MGQKTTINTEVAFPTSNLPMGEKCLQNHEEADCCLQTFSFSLPVLIVIYHSTAWPWAEGDVINKQTLIFLQCASSVLSYHQMLLKFRHRAFNVLKIGLCVSGLCLFGYISACIVKDPYIQDTIHDSVQRCI